MSHRDPEYFLNPESFWPERWIEDEATKPEYNGKTLNCEDAYYPFGFGKRACPGKLWVSMYIKLFMATVRINNSVLISLN